MKSANAESKFTENNIFFPDCSYSVMTDKYAFLSIYLEKDTLINRYMCILFMCFFFNFACLYCDSINAFIDLVLSFIVFSKKY